MDAEWTKILTEIEDHLFPRLKLSSWEKVLYYHLLRHTRVAGSPSSSFSIAGLATSTSMSEATVRDAIRSLNEKGCIIVHERSNRGHLTEVRLPSEIPDIVVLPVKNVVVDIDKIDFFSDRRFLDALLEREGYRCFYSLRELTKENCALDHVVPAVKGGDNSYRNIVVSSHDINALKQDQDAEDFLRLLFRKGMLSPSDIEDRIGPPVVENGTACTQDFINASQCLASASRTNCRTRFRLAMEMLWLSSKWDLIIR